MAKVSGTIMLVYADGVVVAAQKDVTVSWENATVDTTSKDSAGWEEHINGWRSATVDFNNLYSTTGTSAEEFITYITGRTSCVLVIDGLGYPIVGEARPKNITINAGNEDAATFSGSFVFDGGAWMLSGANANLVTDPDGTSNDYDTMTISGTAISSAINLAGNADVLSNTFAVTTGATYKVIFFLTLTSGQVPNVRISTTGGVQQSNIVAAVAGANIITLVTTGDTTPALHLYNTAAANWATTTIYCFKT